MSIITRPVKPIGGGGGTSFIAGPDIIADEVNGDVDTIYTDHNGNITNANCSPSMGLQGTKLADAPNGVPAAKINTDAVETAKIKNAAVTKDKIAAANISLDKWLVTVHEVTFSTGAVAQDGLSRTVVNPTISFPKATYELISLYVKSVTWAGSVGGASPDANDSGVNWSGGVTVFASGLGGGSVQITNAKLVFIFMQRT